MTWVEIALASAVLIALIGSLLSRILVTHEGKDKSEDMGYAQRRRSMGWQSFRFLALAIGFPIVGLLALKGIVTGQAAITIIAVAVGYAFGKMDKG